MSNVKILAFAGSTRTGSFNKKLVSIAAGGARAAGTEVTLIDLRDFPMPLFDGDIEEQSGLPDSAKKLKRLMIDHHGFLISAPEYNSSITAVLKNTIDWTSRPETDDEPPLVCFRGKTIALMSTSPGALGGLRGLVTVRSILGNIGCLVLPDQISIPKAYEAFDDSGALKDESKQKAIIDLGRKLAAFTQKLVG
ncbi:MAG: NAD(P)H-dependent oxidoreductase [Chthoniobacteraceae bacterium]